MSNSAPTENPYPKRQTEAIIYAARYHIQPSEELRPRTLEIARERCRDRHAEQKLGSLAIVVLFLLILGAPAVRYAQTLCSIQPSPSAADLQNQAIALGFKSEIGPNWAMTEAFSQLRQFQAKRLSHAYRSIR